MEYQTQPTQEQVQQEVPTTAQKTNYSLLIACCCIGSLLIVGAVFAGIQIGKSQTPIQQLAPLSNQAATEPIPTTSPTPSTIADPTADWETYTSTEYGFSFKYPTTFTLEEITGRGGDSASVPWKISLTKNSSTILSSIQKRQCNQRTPLVVADKTGNRLTEEGQMNGQLFSNEMVEVQLEEKLCFTIGKYVTGEQASLNEDENTSILKKMSNQDNDIFEMIISTITFSK